MSQQTTGDSPTLLQFFATWCRPCKVLSPIVDAIETKMSAQLQVARVNIDEEEGLTSRFQIMAVPTLVLMKNNQEIWRHTGVLSESNLKTALESALSAQP